MPGLTPGARIRTWPAHPLALISLSVASISDTTSDEVRKRALVNSIVGTTSLVDFTNGNILGTKTIGEKESGPGTNAGYAEPGGSSCRYYCSDKLTDAYSAWAVSLASDGKTYASTGGSGSVTIHSAFPSASADMMDSDSQPFGTRLADIPSGRSKFGLFVDHNPVHDNRIASSNEAGQVSSPQKPLTSWLTDAWAIGLCI